LAKVEESSIAKEILAVLQKYGINVQISDTELSFEMNVNMKNPLVPAGEKDGYALKQGTGERYSVSIEIKDKRFSDE
jgi:hypothetical protein